MAANRSVPFGEAAASALKTRVLLIGSYSDLGKYYITRVTVTYVNHCETSVFAKSPYQARHTIQGPETPFVDQTPAPATKTLHATAPGNTMHLGSNEYSSLSTLSFYTHRHGF